MDTKSLERNIKTIIKTGNGYGPEFLPVLRETKNILKRINKGKPNAEHYFQLGTLCLELEDNQMALDAFKTGYQLNKNHVNCGTYSALLLEQQELWLEALAIYKELNSLDPENIHIAERMLLIFYTQKDIKNVLTHCYYFLDRKLYYPSIYYYISQIFYDCSDTEKAIEYLQNALMLDNDNNVYKIKLIQYLYMKKEYELFLEFEDYLLQEDSIPVLIKLLYANTLAYTGKLAESRSYFVRLLKENKERFLILSEIGLLHSNIEKNIPKAHFINNYILKREPSNVQALTNKALITGGVYSLSAYEKIIQINPNEPLFRMNYGHNLLQAGNLKLGFEYYESRVDLYHKYLVGRLHYPSTINNLKIFVWKEQGIGDQYMWSWLFKFLEKDKIQAKISIDKRLVALMRRSFPTLEFINDDPVDIFNQVNLQNYDAEMIIHSLGRYYVPEIIAAQKDFEEGRFNLSHLRADKHRIAFWKQKIDAITTNKTVGICWRSGLLGDMRDYTYLSATNIVEIFSNIECTVVNLQYDYTDEEVDLIQSALGDRFVNFSEIDLKNDQDELAAVMSALDLVFSVGTAVQALAGALGLKTLSAGGVGTLGKPFNIMIPMVKSIAGPKAMRENSKRYQSEIIKALAD